MMCNDFMLSLLNVVCEMAPYLLLGFLIAGMLHVFVPQNFYRHLSKDNKLSVVWAALLGVPLPLCSCGVIPTAIGLELFSSAIHDTCCMAASTLPHPFKIVCATLLTLFIIFALMKNLFCKFTKKPLDPDTVVYRVEDMHCSHCEAAVVRAVENVQGVEKAKASASANTLTIKGPATEEAIRKAVEGAGYTFKGRK